MLYELMHCNNKKTFRTEIDIEIDALGYNWMDGIENYSLIFAFNLNTRKYISKCLKISRV